MLGFDYELFLKDGIKVPLYVPIGHLCAVGGTNAGKSTGVLYWMYKAQKKEKRLRRTPSCLSCEYWIADFKASHEFMGISEHYGEFEDCYRVIKEFYNEFLITPEGGSGVVKILVIDEIAGLLTHFSMNVTDGSGKTSKVSKTMGDEIRLIMCNILMLGRSKMCYLWLSMQRYTASIFPASSGAADNFNICIGLGSLSVDGRRGLFAGEHLDGEDEMRFGQGQGIVLVDGVGLKTLIIPKVSKKRLLELLKNGE